MKKIFPILIAIILMVVVAAGAVGAWLAEKYAYGTDVMELQTYFEVQDGELAVYLQEERVAQPAVKKDGLCYINLAFVKACINDTFYLDYSENQLLYTDAAGTIRTPFESSQYFVYGEEKQFDGPVTLLREDGVYVALPYVAMFTELEYHVYDYSLQIYTAWEDIPCARITRDTKVRYRGDIKGEILREIAEGEQVQLLESMETWSRIKTRDCVIGYVENEDLVDMGMMPAEKEIAPSDYIAPEYTTIKQRDKICLGWHAIGGVGGNSTLEEMVQGSRGLNVIAPTWFSLNDNAGGYRDYSEASYVERAHSYGLKVWGVWDDFNYENETGEKIDDTLILSSTESRTNLVEGIAQKAVALGLDGVNIDFEKVGGDCREHYAQFLRELSAECRRRGIVLSVDNYMPNDGNRQYRLDVQGRVTDYVILMGYDEHWHGSGNPGSVASIGFVTDGITRALEDVPSDKLINALPLYTIVWKEEGAAVTDEYLTLKNQAEFIDRMGVTTVWDDKTCQNYAEWTSGSKTYKVWLEDMESIRVKLNVMSANGLAGVAAWRLGYGTQDIWNLISAFKLM